MDEKHTKLLIAVVIILSAGLVLISIAGLARPQVTGAAVAGQNGADTGLYFGKGLTFVDDITCKEWLLCYVEEWNTQSTTTEVIPAESPGYLINQTYKIPKADPNCVWDIFSTLFYGTIVPAPVDFPSNPVPIPKECLIQKDPTITTPPEIPEGGFFPT